MSENIGRVKRRRISALSSSSASTSSTTNISFTPVITQSNAITNLEKKDVDWTLFRTPKASQVGPEDRIQSILEMEKNEAMEAGMAGHKRNGKVLRKEMTTVWEKHEVKDFNSIPPGKPDPSVKSINFIVNYTNNNVANVVADNESVVNVNQSGSSILQGPGQLQEESQARIIMLNQNLAQAQADLVQAQNERAKLEKENLLDLIHAKWNIQKKVLYWNIVKFFDWSDDVNFACLDYVWLLDDKRWGNYNTRTQTDYSSNPPMNEAIINMCNTWLQHNEDARVRSYLNKRWSTYQHSFAHHSNTMKSQYFTFDGEQQLRTNLKVNLPLNPSVRIYVYPVNRPNGQANQVAIPGQANQVAMTGQAVQVPPNLAHLGNIFPAEELSDWGTVQSLEKIINSKRNTACHSVSAFDVKILIQRVESYEKMFGMIPDFNTEDRIILSTTKKNFHLLFAGGTALWTDSDEFLKTYKLFNHVNTTYSEH